MFTTLLVEDDVDLRNLMRTMLCHRFPSISVIDAGDGEAALEMMSHSQPDMVLLDISLPGIDGLAVTKKIKELNEDIAIVILCGYDIQEYRQQAFRNGAECYIYKGAVNSTEDILARVEGTIKRKIRRLREPSTCGRRLVKQAT